MKRFVLTGGPYSGKSTLLKALKDKGYAVIEETAREFIDKEMEKEKKDRSYEPKVPWISQKRFAIAFLPVQKEKENKTKGKIIFQDRSLVDPVAYCKAGGDNVEKEFSKAIKDAGYTKAFILDLLPGYKIDSVRKEGIEFRKDVHRMLKETYEHFGIPVVSVPVWSVDERLRFVLSNLS